MKKPVKRPPARKRPELKDIVSGAGQPLDVGLRRDLEARLGHDFSRVRIHADRDAAALAELIGADAVTVGQEVFFAEGAFHPETAQGRLLLAHELLHTVQVPTAPGPLRLGRTEGVLSQPGEPVEVEAEETARGWRDGVVERREQQRASLLRYTRVSADQQRSERLDPAAIVDRVVAGVLRSLRGDPADTSGRVRLQLGRLMPELQETVLETLKVRLPSAEYQQLVDLIGTDENSDVAPEVAPADQPASVADPQPVTDPGRQYDEQTAKDAKQPEEKVDQDKQNADQADERRSEDERKAQQDKYSQEKHKQDTDASADKDAKKKDEDQKAKDAKDGDEKKDKDRQRDKDDKDKGEQDKQKQDAEKKGEAAKQGEQQALQAGQGQAVPAPPAGGAGAAASGPGGAGAAAGAAPTMGDDSAVDKAVQGPESPLVKHGVLERPGQKPKDEPEPGEEPIGLDAAPTAEVAEEPEVPEERQPAAQEAQPDDGLPKADLDVGNVPTADKLTLPADGSPPPPPAPPSFPTPPEPEQKPAEEAKARTQEYRAEQEQEHREPAEIQPAAGQVDENAVDREPVEPTPAAAARIPAQRMAPAEEQEPVGEEPAEVTTVDTPGPGAPGPGLAGASATTPGAEPAGTETPGQEAPGTAPQDQLAGAPGQDGSLEAGGGGCAGAPEPAPAPEQGGACGGGGGGGAAGPGAEEPPQPAAPDVSAQEPQAALASVSTRQPADMVDSLGQVDSSVTTSVGKDRTELQAAPPTADRPSGAPRTMSGPPPEAAPVAAEIPRVEEAKPDEKGKQQRPEDKNVNGAPPATANAAAPTVAGDAQGKLSPEESANLERAVDDIRTTDPALDKATVGSAPTFELKGETDPALADQQAKNLSDTTGKVADVGRRDAAQPLGEDHVYPNVPPETLRGKVPAGGGGAPAAGPQPAAQAGAAGPAAGGVDKVAVSAVAQQERGPQIQAAFGQGAGQLTTERKSHDDQAVQEHQQNQTRIDDAIKESSQQQSAQRQDASAQAKAQRAEWRDAQDKAVTDSNTQAADQHGDTGKQIDVQHTDTNKDIQGRKETDDKDIDDKRAKAEADARKKKDEKKNDDGGFFSWVASKIKQAFDAIVSAITDIFNAARKAIQNVIDGFKKFVNDAIDFARKAVVGLIAKLATALIALGDTLLAAFPGLRDKFRKAIENLRDAAIAKVNQFADGLKKAVNKFLDLLGAALSKLLDVLQKGLLAAVKFVRDAVNGAIAFVQQAIAVLGELAGIIKDIARNPGGWLRNLGTAIRDGVGKLPDVMVAAIKKWFNDKVEQIVGLGKIIFNVLVKGCLKMGQIVSMVWQAVIKALPMMIIQLVLEKVVAALIPGAGAILAMIQTIMAAWGSISKILGALSKLLSFLKAIKTGGVTAACLFAETVAAGAVALLDFITNFLISKLASAAKGVAGKLKGIADKIMKGLARGARKVRQFAGKAFNGAKKAGKAGLAFLKKGASKAGGLVRRGVGKVLGGVKKGWNKVKGGLKALGGKLARTKLGKALINVGNKIKKGYQKLKQKVSDWRNKKRPPEKPPTAEERLAKAVVRIKPKVDLLLRKGIWASVFRAVLRGLRGWYRLTAIDLVGSLRFKVVARLNPDENVTDGVKDASSGQEIDRDKLPVTPRPPSASPEQSGEGEVRPRSTEKKQAEGEPTSKGKRKAPTESEPEKKTPARADEKDEDTGDEKGKIPRLSTRPGEPEQKPSAGSGWPPVGPVGKKPKLGEPGGDTWRYERYRQARYKQGRKEEEVLPFEEWKSTHYDVAAKGGRPGRRGGAEQAAMKDRLTKEEGVREVENVNLGGHFPDGIRPKPEGGNDYFEVGKMLNKGIPEARERGKLQKEIDALGHGETITFVDKTDGVRRITYRKGDKVDLKKFKGS
ncbi:DUF4157 domain-containing protein [Amycolatopsis mongoliensis]|uniref:DUF4157 domain-containing protein n=1 Tax=Amycolatopsis mongoliensis TaxID=715475 RepID=A0A9Y2JK40_9PSEU|nr:DUF4157 domain-containing protein [Amycolatopsis sp. 4-36]WIX99169.1 DUF4157 domain-containing protein [Amycolatopsis sp. 4-36]